MFLRLTLALVLALALSLPASARADSPYELALEYDIPVFLLGAAMTTPAFLEIEPPECLPDCDENDVNAFDRRVMGRYHPAAQNVADVMVVSLATLPLALHLIDSHDDGWLPDAVIHLQTLVMALGLTQMTKLAVRRAAPFVYDERVPESVRYGDSDGPRSFWSGHAATAFSSTTAYAVTYWLRHPNSPWRWVIAATGAALSTSVGLLKINAGYHYPTDIIAGAGAGIATGMLVPLLHTL